MASYISQSYNVYTCINQIHNNNKNKISLKNNVRNPIW